jgi:tetratricopeptide (TPR) repeat protein
MEFATAIKKTDELLAVDPYCANMLYEMKAKTNMALNNNIDASTDIEMAEKTGSTKELIKELSERASLVSSVFLNYNSSNFDVLIKSGKDLFNQKAYVNALRFFEKCEQIKPQDESVLNNICACYYNLARPDKVKEYYSKIIANNFQRNSNLETYLSTNTIKY